MAQSAPARTKINTKVTQPAPGRSSRRSAGRPGPGRPPRGPRVSGDARDSVRQSARPVIELDFGILVYPPEAEGEPWRAVFTENGQRKYRQGATEAKLLFTWVVVSSTCPFGFSDYGFLRDRLAQLADLG